MDAAGQDDDEDEDPISVEWSAGNKLQAAGDVQVVVSACGATDGDGCVSGMWDGTGGSGNSWRRPRFKGDPHDAGERDR